MFDTKTVSLEWGGKTLTLETGRIARQADGAVLATYGETTVLATVVSAKAPKPGVDFFPLTVNYQEKAFAAGADIREMAGDTPASLLLHDRFTRWDEVAATRTPLVAAVRGGLLSLEEACERYKLTVDEFLSWQRSIDKHGLAGLRATRVQDYRN